LRYNGDYFEDGRHAIFHNMKLLTNITDDAKKKEYNEILKQASFWADSRIPVLMGFESVCFAANPHLLAELTKARDYDYKEAKLSKTIVHNLQNIIGSNIVKASFTGSLDPQDLSEYINTSTGADERRTYETGKISGRLEMTRPKLPGGSLKALIPIVVIGFIIFLAWQTGMLDQLLNIGAS
jgi:hypothetical protein